MNVNFKYYTYMLMLCAHACIMYLLLSSSLMLRLPKQKRGRNSNKKLVTLRKQDQTGHIYEFHFIFHPRKFGFNFVHFNLKCQFMKQKLAIFFIFNVGYLTYFNVTWQRKDLKYHTFRVFAIFKFHYSAHVHCVYAQFRYLEIEEEI